MSQTKLSLKTLLANSQSWNAALSRDYPIPLEFLEAFPDLWNWEALSANRTLAWTKDFVLAHADRFSPLELADNPSLPWSIQLIDQLVNDDILEWDHLHRCPAIFADIELLGHCWPHWNKTARQHLEDDFRMAGDYEFLLSERWACPPEQVYALVESMPSIHWDLLGDIRGFPWSIEFLNKHSDRLDWNRLSDNWWLPWSEELILAFEDRWDWNYLSSSVKWTPALLKRFEHRDDLDLSRLSGEDESFDFPWTEELLIRYRGRIDWLDIDGEEEYLDGFINSESFTWTPSLFEAVRDDVERCFSKELEAQDLDKEDWPEYWTYHCDTQNWSEEFASYIIGLDTANEIAYLDYSSLLRCGKGPGTVEFVKKHSEEYSSIWSNPHAPVEALIPHFLDELKPWQWSSIYQNENFRPSADFVQKYQHVLDFAEISSSACLTPALLEQFLERWDWKQLERNPTLTYEMILAHRDRWFYGRALSRHSAITQAYHDGVLDLTLPVDIQWIICSSGEFSKLVSHSLLEQFVAAQCDQAMLRNPEIEALAGPQNRQEICQQYGEWLRPHSPEHSAFIDSMLAGENDHQKIVAYEKSIGLTAQKSVWQYGFLHTLHRPTCHSPQGFNRREFFYLNELSFATHNLSDSEVTQKLLENVVEACPLLERLNINSSSIDSLECLRGLPELKHLRVGFTGLGSLSGIDSLQKLTHLFLWGTGISDLSVLSRLENLEWLHIGYNDITDLSPLSGLTHLCQLDMRFTNVQDLSPLYGLKNLREILLENTEVSTREIAALKEHLPDLQICDYSEYWQDKNTQDPFVT